MVEPGPVPHVGGPILPACAPLVLTNNQPQARLTDMATCVGAPDVIAMGAATVLVHGLPAARVGDSTAHGGAIVKGFPMVLIGGPAFALPPNVKVSGPPDFQQQVYRDLYSLSTTPGGAEIFKQIGAKGVPVTIVPVAGNTGGGTALNGKDAQNGTARGSTVAYNPDYHSNAHDSAGKPSPPLILGHEMCQAVNNANGPAGRDHSH
jgi:uncharacterized Zn-binding protein involved in type VI secretion